MSLPWLSAIGMIAGSFTAITMILLRLIGLLEPFMDMFDVFFGQSAGAKKGGRYLFSIVLISLIFYVCYHVIFNIAGASKETGLTDRFQFEPTQRDKFFYWAVFSLPFIIALVIAYI